MYGMGLKRVRDRDCFGCVCVYISYEGGRMRCPVVDRRVLEVSTAPCEVRVAGLQTGQAGQRHTDTVSGNARSKGEQAGCVCGPVISVGS